VEKNKLHPLGKSKFTRGQVETAIQVLMEGRTVSNWAKSQMNFLDVDVGTPEGAAVFEKAKRKLAEDLIR